MSEAERIALEAFKAAGQTYRADQTAMIQAREAAALANEVAQAAARHENR
jgi:hypothetical protein